MFLLCKTEHADFISHAICTIIVHLKTNKPVILAQADGISTFTYACTYYLRYCFKLTIRPCCHAVLVTLLLAVNTTLCIFSLTQMLTSVIVQTTGAVTIFVPTLPEVITARARRDIH